ncbi:MAG: radical SAM family heme chaperone HemW [Clostridia bacterium]
MKEFSLYIHIPFCVSKCVYCDFLSKPCDKQTIDKYFNALYAEITKAGKRCNKTVTTLYIGGGTPSFVDVKYIDKLFLCLKQNFNLNLIEATIECNPESINSSKLECYKNNGINRLSIGIQSLNDEILKNIGRAHDSKMALAAVALAKKYFDNVSVDLMTGLPWQTVDDIKFEVDTLLKFNIPHFSVYGLKVEEGTKLFEQVADGTVFINEDLSVDLYDEAYKILLANGFHRYEVSNFSYVGFESQHNLAYWRRTDYLGLGAGAFSFVDGARFNNVQSIDDYIKIIENGNFAYGEMLPIVGDDAEFEEIMLSLRTCYGLDILKFNKKFDCNFKLKYAFALDKVKQYTALNNDNLVVLDEYFYILNSILVEFLL